MTEQVVSVFVCVCVCVFVFSVCLYKKFLAFQSSKESYLKLQLSLNIPFVVPLEFHQFDEE